jgi:inosine-uridine nucleoside N-ribohydrolase
VAKFIAGLPEGWPVWDEIAAGVLLDPSIVTSQQSLYIDCNTQFSAGYGDFLSWRAGYQPGLGEQRAQVVHTVDVARLEELMVRALAHKSNGR